VSKITPVKGTRDFYPEDMAFRQWLYAIIRDVSQRYGYQEYDGPFLERLELYAAKSGEELVKEQSFVFPDRGGDLIALRPELTPSLARMVATRAKSLPRPLRWWSFGPFWRYERPQKGRSREFFQWNLDILGVTSPESDAEVAAVAADFFRAAGLGPEQIRILVNDRRLAERHLDGIGVSSERHSAVFRLIDRRDKMSAQAWAAYAQEIGLSKSQVPKLEDLLEQKEAWRGSEELVAFFDALGALGVSKYFAFEPTIIRGLDYYTGSVYEARDASSKHRAILGGGRYDNLVSDVGGDLVPATGFAMGDMVVRLALEEAGEVPSLSVNPASVLVVSFGKLPPSTSLETCAQLRAAGVPTAWYPFEDRLPKQLKFADQQGFSLAVILGPDELASGRVTIKDLRSSVQVSVVRADLAQRVVDMLTSGAAAPSR
jgi:histidyl-tRNA synthetase